MRKQAPWNWVLFAVSVWGSGALLPALAQADAVPVTLLHTNDLHSHFRGETDLLGLGGVARLKTAISRVRAAVPNSLLVDGGDWSEGNIYFTEGGGRETLRMMDFLTYDVAVVGNHDWLNGAANLMSIIDQAQLRMKVIASNVATSDYDREKEFRKLIPPYVIQEVGGVKIAFIGLLTYEFIYDKFLLPVHVTEPFAATRDLAHQLKKSVDAVVVISHNSIKINQGVLTAAPDVDLVVGAHDHVKLTAPVVVERPGAKAGWIVETGCWGRYLGRVDMRVTPRNRTEPASRGSVDLVSYRLEQMDAGVPEDPETLKRITALEATIESYRGPIFHDHVGDSEIEIARDSQENLMGDLATDAYLDATRADLALDQTNFIYNSIHAGPLTTADLFNANPGVYDPRTQKAWMLNLVPIRGRALSSVLNLIYANKSLSQSGAIHFAGAEIIYNSPLGAQSMTRSPESWGEAGTLGFTAPTLTADVMPTGLSIQSFKVRGEELQNDRTYMVAAPGGIVQALEFLNSILPGSVPLNQMRSFGQEGWRVIADYVTAHSPIRAETIHFGRVHSVQPDLAILYDDIRWEQTARDAWGRAIARVHVRVRNVGMGDSPSGTAAAGPRLQLRLNDYGVDYSRPEVYQPIAPAQGLPALRTGQSAELSWEGITVPETLGLYAISAVVIGNESEVNHTNDGVTHYAAAAPTTLRRLAPNR